MSRTTRRMKRPPSDRLFLFSVFFFLFFLRLSLLLPFSGLACFHHHSLTLKVSSLCCCCCSLSLCSPSTRICIRTFLLQMRPRRGRARERASEFSVRTAFLALLSFSLSVCVRWWCFGNASSRVPLSFASSLQETIRESKGERRPFRLDATVAESLLLLLLLLWFASLRRCACA